MSAQRLPRAWSFSRRELRLVRGLGKEMGIRRALATRVRAHLDLDGVTSTALRALEDELRSTRDLFATHRLGSAATAERLGLDEPVADATPGPALIEQMLALQCWLAQQPAASTLISVVLPTFNRVTTMSEAIASVQAQTHSPWELIVIDDGSSDETAETVTQLGDERIRYVRAERVGSPTARNRGLDEARGEVIAYLDDDNLMAPGWLAAVAWAFSRRPDIDVVYGARVIEDESMFGSPAAMPRVLLSPYDRPRLEQVNFTDTNVIAHRAGLAEARWDPALVGVADWDLVLRLTATKPPLVLPTCAVLYRTNAPHRQSANPRLAVSRAALQERLATRHRT